METLGLFSAALPAPAGPAAVSCFLLSPSQEKELYLLDDPLAAVDADVANHIMQKCIFGVLKHKTRVLCTHRTEFLEKADALLLMDNGRIVKTGTLSSQAFTCACVLEWLEGIRIN